MDGLRTATDLLGLAQGATLQRNDVHAWRISIMHCMGFLPELRALLSAEERERAGKFMFADSRNQFTVGRATLRLVLGRYLRTAPSSVQFVYGEHGKPTLADGQSLRFNVAHSKDIVLIAVADAFDIGVDVELRRADVEPEELAPQCLDAEEIDRLRALAPADRRVAFFEYWTNKEAVSKALGYGLASPLTAIHVCDNGGHPVEMLWSSGTATNRWFAYRLDVGPDYSAAVATPLPSHRVTLLGSAWRESARANER